MNWDDILPPDVAAAQRRSERRRAVARALGLGVSKKEIAKQLKTTVGWVTDVESRIAPAKYPWSRYKDPYKDHYLDSPAEAYLSEAKTRSAITEFLMAFADEAAWDWARRRARKRGDGVVVISSVHQREGRARYIRAARSVAKSFQYP